MEPLSSERIQQILSDELARQLKKGWQIIGVGPMGAIMGRNKPKHNGILGGLLFAPISLVLSALWVAARNFDEKSEGLVITVSQYGDVTTEVVDYEQMMAQAAVQQAALDNNNPPNK